MSRYHALSQRASGESRVSARPPNGCVRPGVSKLASLPACTPKIATAATATTSTSNRVDTTVSTALRSASARAGPSRRRAIACTPMPALDLPIADSFWADHRNAITAIVTLIVTFVLAQLVDRAIIARGTRLAQAMPGPISPVTSTRLRLVRRLIYAGIIVIGIALALSQFPSVKRVATGILASSAVLGLVVGFAARQTFANAVAGVLLAITQPIRIGDLVTFEGATGTVEDIRLTYTYVRTDDGTRIVIPNERLAQNTVHNHSILDAALKVVVSVWIPPGADPVRALAVLRGGEDLEVSVAEVDKDGVRLEAVAWARSPTEQGQMAAGLRVSCLERLRDAGLSSETGS